MIFLGPFNAMLQVIAAFLIFVACYLALVLSAIIGLVIAELISESANLVRAYGRRSVSLDTRVLSEVKGARTVIRFRPDRPLRLHLWS
jgi:hypothetical protein